MSGGQLANLIVAGIPLTMLCMLAKSWLLLHAKLQTITGSGSYLLLGVATGHYNDALLPSGSGWRAHHVQQGHPLQEAAPSSTPCGGKAVKFGATCTTQPNDAVTHVAAYVNGTEKVCSPLLANVHCAFKNVSTGTALQPTVACVCIVYK